MKGILVTAGCRDGERQLARPIIMAHELVRHVSLTRQFELRQKNWKPNMEVVEEAELYKVDGVLAGEYTPPNATNEHEMVCWDPKAYQEIKHHNESDCS